VLGSVALRKTTCGFPVALCIYPYKVVGQRELVGQFRPADGLALPGGGKLGHQISRRSHHCGGVVPCSALMPCRPSFEEKSDSSGPHPVGQGGFEVP